MQQEKGFSLASLPFQLTRSPLKRTRPCGSSGGVDFCVTQLLTPATVMQAS